MIELILALAIVGVILYFLESLPMSPPIRTLIRVVIVILVILYLVRLFGLDVPLPRAR